MKALLKLATTVASIKKPPAPTKPGLKDSALPPDGAAPHPGMQMSSLGVPTAAMATAHKKVVPSIGANNKAPKMKLPPVQK